MLTTIVGLYSIAKSICRLCCDYGKLLRPIAFSFHFYWAENNTLGLQAIL
jgi:hypothetical protein